MSSPTLSRRPAPAPATVAVRPVVLDAPDRGDDLQVRVTAPVTGDGLPVLVLSHGFGQSMDDYAPLVGHWAANGFVVVQPTHLDSRTLALPADDPRTPTIWRSRIEDLVRVLDGLDGLAAAVPGLAGRLDRSRIALAGHSWGATSASALLGARVLDAEGRPGPDMTDTRVGAAVLLALAGTGGEDLTPFAAETFAFMNPDFSRMATPSLLVAGDHDQSALSLRGPDWWSDGFRLAPGATDLLTLFGGEHSLGGVQGYDDTHTTDESPARVALVQRMSLAYLRTALGLDEDAWPDACAELRAEPEPGGRVEQKARLVAQASTPATTS